jgi:signal transduction histidine kinase
MSNEKPVPETTMPDGWGRFQLHLLLRIIVLATIVFAIVMIGRGTTPEMQPIFAIMTIDLLLSAPFYAWGRRHRSGLRSLSLAIMVNDAIFVTAGLYLLGGVNAVYGLPLYSFLIVATAALHSSRGAFLIAIVASALYGVMALGSWSGWIPERAGPFPFSFTEAWPWTTALVNTSTNLTLALIASVLSEMMRRALARSREFESRLRELNKELGHRVESATRELRGANTRLSAQNRELEHTLGQVAVLAHATSHDLRSPVAAAAEALRLAKKTADDTERDELTQLAGENVARADRMLAGLRDLMRTVDSRSPASAIQVRPVLDDVLAELRTARGGAEIPVQAVAELGEIEIRTERLAHVLRNLIGNALEHNRGRGDLLIHVGRDSTDGENSFYVSDNGVGVPAEIRHKILEPFHRGPSAKGDGLGLGLSLVREIVAQAGGKVWVESPPGEGFTCHFAFPGNQKD